MTKCEKIQLVKRCISEIEGDLKMIESCVGSESESEFVLAYSLAISEMNDMVSYIARHFPNTPSDE